MVRKNLVPFAKVSAGSVQDLINQMRGGSNEETNVNSVNNSTSDSNQVSTEETKKSIVPKAVVSVDSEIQRMRELLTSGREAVIDSDGTISAVDEVRTGDATPKAKTVPKAVVSVDTTSNSVQDMINEMRGTTSSESNQNIKTDIDFTSDNASPKKTGIIPKAVVSADSQWYTTNKDLFEAEIVAMHDFKPNARYDYFNDGRMYWSVQFTPTIAGKKTRTYNLALVYDHDHPKARYGSSVKAYLLSPTIEDLQKIVNGMPEIKDKSIPHLLRDSNGELYLCSADTTNCKDDLDKGGITSAATSLRFAMRWINIFELGLIDPITWDKFHKHGEI